MDSRIEQAKRVQQKYTDQLMQNQHVMGVSVYPVDGYVHKPEVYALMVLVDDENAQHDIPSHLEDVPVIIKPIGRAKLQ